MDYDSKKSLQHDKHKQNQIKYLSEMNFSFKYLLRSCQLFYHNLMIQKEKTKSINKTKPNSNIALSMDTIPILDMEDEDIGEQLVQSFKSIGFVIIGNHGISDQIIDQAFKRSRQVFDLSKQQKAKLGFRYQSDRNRGYTGPGEQILDQENKTNEKKETFDLGHPDGPDQLRYFPKNAQFVEISKTIYNKFFQVYKKIMRQLQKGLQLQEGTITNKCCKDFYEQTLRFLYYPQITEAQLQKTGKIRAGAHSDYGTITLLIQKPGFGQNGLRALNADKDWVAVNPPDYSIVVNLGDLFQHWTNDVLKSTIHKVQVDDIIYQKLKKGEILKVPQRQTIVMFCDPDQGEIFQCLPNFGEPKYKPIDGKQYVNGRIQTTYGIKKK